MTQSKEYLTKFATIAAQTPFYLLPEEQMEFVRLLAFKYQFTLQNLRIVTEIALDLNMWNEGSIIDICGTQEINSTTKTAGKKQFLGRLSAHWEFMKSQPNQYPERAYPTTHDAGKAQPVVKPRDKLGLGFCPVASEKTRYVSMPFIPAPRAVPGQLLPTPLLW